MLGMRLGERFTSWERLSLSYEPSEGGARKMQVQSYGDLETKILSNYLTWSLLLLLFHNNVTGDRSQGPMTGNTNKNRYCSPFPSFKI